MGSKTPATTEQKQVQTSAPPAWLENVGVGMRIKCMTQGLGVMCMEDLVLPR